MSRRRVGILLAAAAGSALAAAAMASELQWQRQAAGMDAAAADGNYAREELHHAWSQMISDLHAARATLEAPQNFAAPYGDQNLATGYRYLLGHVHRLIETELHQAENHPYLMRYPSQFTKFGLDNADTKYLYAPIEPNSTYLLIGRSENSSHWRGKAPARRGLLAPRHVTFEVQSLLPGDSGEISELRAGDQIVTASINAFDLEQGRDGSFEIMISPARPAGYAGNHLQTITGPEEAPVQARHLMIREVFEDWARERSLYLEIVKIGKAGTAPAAPEAAVIGTGLREIGRKTSNHVRFWNELYGKALEPFADTNGDGVRRFPKNCLGVPGLSAADDGPLRSVSGGTWELHEDEALIIELTLPGKPFYAGLQLTDFWGQSLDYANRTTSLNLKQSVTDEDSVRRYVVAHRDPGLSNWLDAGGLKAGYILQTLHYLQPPADGEAVQVNCQTVKFDELEGALPEKSLRLDALARRKQIMGRQQHVARRYRQY